MIFMLYSPCPWFYKVQVTSVITKHWYKESDLLSYLYTLIEHSPKLPVYDFRITAWSVSKTEACKLQTKNMIKLTALVIPPAQLRCWDKKCMNEFWSKSRFFYHCMQNLSEYAVKLCSHACVTQLHVNSLMFGIAWHLQVLCRVFIQYMHI